MRKIMLLLCLAVFSLATAQQTDFKNYKVERTKVNDLVHTKLKVDFDFSKSQMNGEAWLTLTPHFYDISKLELDAKAMLIHEVSMDGNKLGYNYEKDILTIDLGKVYKKGEEYSIYIKYTARPEEVKQEGSAAITDAKGLYFIDPRDEDPEKPTQIWTQGETESSSCWFPTIDAPNQKTTQEIYMTVPSKYVTLSNGLLLEQKDNGNNTRTDYWKMDQKHAPYLFFMGVGEFSIVKDKWEDLAVDYYVEKKYEPYAQEIFGHTPEMMTFFSKLTGVRYPWVKYHQMVGRDYVSGAMENTTAVIHGEGVYQTHSELVDENTWESTIAHELFHHWFGDYVTCASWSNLTVNESFANYSEYLWFEYKYGRDKADEHLYSDTQGYLLGNNQFKDLVRFYYKKREDMFDAVSYNKGGAILHMLRSYLGDDAFFAGLNKYLEDNKFGTGEAHQLRIALEEVSGRDLNWFFNQWYFGNNNIKMDVNYDYDEVSSVVTIDLNQKDKIFEFPLTIDIYENGIKKSHDVWVDKQSQSFKFEYTRKPDLINVGAKRVLLAQINDNSKTLQNYIFQYNNAPLFLDRREAILEIAKHQDDKAAFETLVKALNDKYHGLRILALEHIDLSNKKDRRKKNAIKIIEKLAKSDPKTLVQAEAIEVLGKLMEDKYENIFKKGLTSESNSVRKSSITALYQNPKTKAYVIEKAKTYPKDEKELLADAIAHIFVKEKVETEMPFIANHVLEGMFYTQDQQTQALYKNAFDWIGSSNNTEAITNLVNKLVEIGKRYKQYGLDKIGIQLLRQMNDFQNKENHSNKAENVAIINKGIERLVE
ncbi:M1 family metallopeptidase [Aureivirga sp. CE67]|uniref:M1 family metallopeptidase n=1 Tax=Aureivirga sp. CE67 TaxID=1788983 RepID=UPI0018CBBC4C|nr:M1 family metallopeptidase [Aureivirga sp. CE67]